MGAPEPGAVRMSELQSFQGPFGLGMDPHSPSRFVPATRPGGAFSLFGHMEIANARYRNRPPTTAPLRHRHQDAIQRHLFCFHYLIR